MLKLSKVVNNLLNISVVISLASMSILVFANVVMRYVFNTGFTWTEEMAKIFLTWMTFLGAIAALRDNQHIGVDLLVKKLPLTLKKIVFAVSNLLIIYCLWLVLRGSWNITMLNVENVTPATGLPLSYVYGIGIVSSIGMGGILIVNLYNVLFSKSTDIELIMTEDSEELMGHASNK